MADVRDVLAKKGHVVYRTEADASVLEATKQMTAHGVGALVVTQGERVIGMVTERDVLSRVVAAEREPGRTKVADVMTTDVRYAQMDTNLEEIAEVMAQKRVRHMPICDELGRLEGMVSMGDINLWRTEGQKAEIEVLTEYIHGRV